MHYRNGREAKNGDKVVQLDSSYDVSTSTSKATISAVGVLFDAQPGDSFCNGSIAPLLGGIVRGACLIDCLHLDDFAALLAEHGLDKRPPAGK